MFNNIFELALITPTMDSIIGLQKIRKDDEPIDNGIIYSIHRIDEGTIDIGYIEKLKDLGLEKILGEYRFDYRFGRKNHLKILIDTLYELNHRKVIGEGVFRFNKNLIRHLNVLGWPIENIATSQSNKDRLYNMDKMKVIQKRWV